MIMNQVMYSLKFLIFKSQYTMINISFNLHSLLKEHCIQPVSVCSEMSVQSWHYRIPHQLEETSWRTGASIAKNNNHFLR